MPDRPRLPGSWRPIVTPTPIRVRPPPAPVTPPAPGGSAPPPAPPPAPPRPTRPGGAIVPPSIGGRRPVDPGVLHPTVVHDDFPPVDPATMTARQMVDEIHRRAAAVDEHFHAIGTLLRALDDPERLRELGYTDIDVLLVRESLPSKPTARRLATAAVLPLQIAKDLGHTKSYELVRWAREVRGARTDAAVVAIVRATTEINGVPIAELTTRQIADAIDRPDAGTRASRARTRDALRGLTSHVRKELKKAGVKSRTTIDEHDDRGPELCIRIASIEDVQRLLDALEDREP